MNKRIIVSLSSLIVVTLVIAGTVLLYDRINNSSILKNNQKEDTEAVEKKYNDEESGRQSDELEGQPEKILIREAVAVSNNSPEYDMKASLCKKNNGDIFFELQYYNEGQSVIKALGTDLIPEIKDIFQNREKDNGSYKINSVYLNPRNMKAYFMIIGKNLGESFDCAIYSCNLKDIEVKKIYAEPGRYSELAFSKDYKYLAFSFYDSPISSKYQEKSLLQVLDSGSDEFIIKGSRDNMGNQIGYGNNNDKYIYDYDFLSWNLNTTLNLKETSTPKNGVGTNQTREVIYDVLSNKFLNMEGDKPATGVDVQKQERQVKDESEPVKTIRSFYEYLAAEQYSKAYNILDEKFRLNAFKLLGTAELSKKDIDVNNFSAYGSLLKTVKLDSIVSEKASETTSVVYFYQKFSFGEGDTVKQALTATMRKTENGWKVVSLDDGSINEKPFKQ